MKKSIELLLAVVGMIFVISTAVIFTVAFKPLYYRDVRELKLSETYGYEESVIKDNYDELIAYNLSPFHEKLIFPDFPMSEEARIHFKEVKNIFQGFLAASILTGIVFLTTLILKARKRELDYLRVCGWLTIGVPIIVAGILLTGWERCFILFHELVFDNDYWYFDPITDPIIDVLPDAFFFHAAMMILVLILLGSVSMIWAGRKRKRLEEKGGCR